jgi:hypothetical protein
MAALARSRSLSTRWWTTPEAIGAHQRPLDVPSIANQAAPSSGEVEHRGDNSEHERAVAQSTSPVAPGARASTVRTACPASECARSGERCASRAARAHDRRTGCRWPTPCYVRRAAGAIWRRVRGGARRRAARSCARRLATRSRRWLAWSAPCAPSCRCCAATRQRAPRRGPLRASADSALSLFDDAAFAARAADSTDATLASIVLELCEQLEKQIYHSAHGAATVSLAPPSAADAFFAANIKTCTDWYARVRPQFMALALALGARDEVARHGEQRIADLRAQVGGESNVDVAARLARADATMVSRWAVQFGVALLQTASAFAERGEPDVIDGYAVHAEQLIAACKAQGVALALPLDELRGCTPRRLAPPSAPHNCTERFWRAPTRSARRGARFAATACSFAWCSSAIGARWRRCAAAATAPKLDALISDDFVRAMAAYSEGAFPQARARLAHGGAAQRARVRRRDAAADAGALRRDASALGQRADCDACAAAGRPPSRRRRCAAARSILLPSLQVLNDVSLPTAALHAVALCESATAAPQLGARRRATRRGAVADERHARGC